MRAVNFRVALLSSLALLGCKTLDMSEDMGPSARFSAMRRVFVNDSAANDSLPSALANVGVKFVLQPGKNYGLRMESAGLTDRIGLYLYENGELKNWGPYTAQPAGSGEVFELRSDRLRADFFVAMLQTSDRPAAAARLSKIRLVPLAPSESRALEVRLLVVRRISTLPTNTDRVAFADKLLADLAALFLPYGITLTVSQELVEPDSPPITVPFGGNSPALPGRRVPGAVHLYLVDNITAGSTFGTILGFAPREALDLSSDLDSRVILNGRASESLLVTTAAHELGHFFGLRHTTATDMEILDEADWSNRDDGFSSTPACSVLTKVSAPSQTGSPAEGPRFCLFRALPTCPASCDVTNLMFAYDCPTGAGGQRRLSTEQQVFIRSNLALLQP